MTCLLVTPVIEDINFSTINPYFKKTVGRSSIDFWNVENCHIDSDNEINTLVSDILDSEMGTNLSETDNAVEEVFKAQTPLNEVVRKYSHHTKAKRRKGVSNVNVKAIPKRERNRLAARRCRKKQKDRIEILEKEVGDIEKKNANVGKEIEMLQRQLQEIRDSLRAHDCVLRSPSSDRVAP